MYPRINDIATDLDDPPDFPIGKPRAYPRRFKAIVRQHYPDLAPLRLDRPAGEVFAAACRLADHRERWSVTSADHEGGLLQGVAVTRLLRFRDDFVVRVRGDGDGAVVDMRSRSRIGKSDLGANAARIRAFFTDLEQAVR